LALAGAAFALEGCSGEPPPDEAEITSHVDEGSVAISSLPFVDAASNTRVLAELLAKPTELGETTALHVRLPPPQNRELQDSMVRVIGQPESPQVLFRSDVLAQLGVIKQSPGKEFFTAFSTLPPEQLEVQARNLEQIASGVFGQTTEETVVFEGRSAVARTINPRIDPAAFVPGNLIPVAGCPILPVSEQAAWDKSLFIRDPRVILDKSRTWDPCTGAGTQGGVWTFAHLIREMAIGSGSTAEQFALNWLSTWLNNQTINGDVVAARTAMFNQVIQPWATASGVTATLLTNIFGKKFVSLTGPLNLNIAPFKLLAIVNRIDLGKTAHGGGGYGGSTTDRPVDAGELRFIFEVVQPNPWGAGTEASCGRKAFTTIFEYGVPITGCFGVVKWAQQWASLQSFPGFTAAYLAQLQSMTESVVLNGAAPAKGNQNAINQVRTNEIALGNIWELREFTLSTENPDVPANGPLRPHTVAQTTNDGAFSAAGADPTINAFVTGPVAAGVPAGSTNPLHCSASYTVPFSFGGLNFRGGNALIPPGRWLANNVNAVPTAQNVCARHQFSLNTCHGCHRDDAGTNGMLAPNGVPSTSFTHVDLRLGTGIPVIPVRLSNFLTGSGPGLVFPVADTQGLPLGFPGKWLFRDLHDRLQRLFTIAFCTSCLRMTPMRAEIVSIFDLVPADIGPGDPAPSFKVGPVTDIRVVQQLLDARASFAGEVRDEPADFIRQTEEIAH
jgi:hypothetical protein